MTLYTTNKDCYFNGDAIHILTLIVDGADTITLGSDGSRVHSESQGWLNYQVQTYNVVENVAPIITSVKYNPGGIDLNGTIGVPYEINSIVVEVSDDTDGVVMGSDFLNTNFVVDIVLQGADITFQSHSPLQLHSANGATILLSNSKTGTYLNYNTDYVFN